MTHAEKTLALHLEELGRAIDRASELATAATNACPDYHKSSRLSRVADSLDEAREHLDARAPGRGHGVGEMSAAIARLKHIAANLDALAVPHEQFAANYGSKIEAAEGAAYRKAAAIIREATR